MRVLRSARSAARRVRDALDPAAAGAAAQRGRRWKAAAAHFERALRRRPTRDLLLRAASTQERLGDLERRDELVAAADRLHPSPRYDSRAAFSLSNARPHEREAVARFTSRHGARLAATATASAAAAAAGADRRRPVHAFVYWDGDERPDVAEHCIAEMRKHLPADLALVELNARNLHEWVRIDHRIMDRVDIPAHAADIIRLHLLAEHGGMWIDASCLLNATFPEFAVDLMRQDFFVFTYAGSRTGNWFIWAEPGSYRLQLITAALDAWFVSGRTWTNYFQFHDVVEMLYWTDDRYRREWDGGLAIHPRAFFDCHRALGVPLTDEEWHAVRFAQPINKLSWRKYNAPALRADPSTGIARFVAEPLLDPVA